MTDFQEINIVKDVNQSPYRLCQSLERGLELLAALNRHPAGAATITQLSQQVGQHRTTVKRLLETLVAAGYVRVQASDNLYRLTFRVRALSEGFRDSVWFTEVAGPLLRTAGRSLVWPCSILTLEGDHLVIRDSTRSYSPFSLHPGMPGRRLPLLTTAAGRAYLAFCDSRERKALLNSVAARHDSNATRSPASISAALRKVRSVGYATNRGEWESEERFAAIAVPICHEGRAIASLNVTFLLDALTEHEALERFLPTLKDIQQKLEGKFDTRFSGWNQ